MSSSPSHVEEEEPDSVSTSMSSEAAATENNNQSASRGDGGGLRGGGDQEEAVVDSSEDVTSSSTSSSVSFVSSNVCVENEDEEISSSGDVGGGGSDGTAASSKNVFAQPMLPPPLAPSSKSASPSPASSSSDRKGSKGPSAGSSERPSSSSSSSSTSKSKEKVAKEKQDKYNAILSTLKYHPPKCGSPSADPRYNLEVLKNGSIVDSVKFSPEDNKGYYIIGRVPGCDIVAENPTVSRLHAVLQFVNCPKKGDEGDGVSSGGGGDEEPQETGLYLFDLKSTHGTFLNKNQVFPHKFYRVHVGHVIKFGSSQRMYIVNGPSEDEEEESDKSVTELQNEKLKKDLERKRLEEEQQLKRTPSSTLPNEKNVEVDGIDWGMGEDADEETDMRVNPFAMDYESSDLTLDNPKKSLKSWFEREGEELEYEMKEKGNGQYVCRIALPIDGPTDGPVYAESEIKAKKKEAANDAALRACQILDSHGLLRTSNQESRKRKDRKYEDEDYYSSDEDTFLDRTGSVEKKREKRMRIAGKIEDKVETYDSLREKYSELEAEISDLQANIAKSQQMKARADDGEMDIDDYMKMLKTGVFDVKKLRSRLREATEEMQRTKTLMDIAKPAELPSYLQKKTPNSSAEATTTAASSSSTKAEPVTKDPEDESKSPEPVMEGAEEEPSSRRSLVGPTKPPSSSSPLKSALTKKQKLYGLILPSSLKPGLRPPEVPDAVRQASIDELEKEDEVENESSSGEEDEAEADSNNAGAGNVEDEPEEEPDQGPEFVPQSKKKKRQRYRNKQKPKGPSSTTSHDFEDPNYSVWVPPKNQSGDGRTSLNEKLGY